MSTALFPSTLKGLAWPIQRTEIWQTRSQKAVSGKQLDIADWSMPKHRWEAQFSVLRSATAYMEFQTMLGFVNARKGGYDSFLYSDPNDSTATGSTIGTGDSTNKTFQLARTMPGTTFAETIYGPTAISAVYVGGTSFTSTQWTPYYWGTTRPGQVVFSTFAPTTGQAVTADFSFAWPVKFDTDDMTFGEFVKHFMEVKKFSMSSLK